MRGLKTFAALFLATATPGAVDGFSKDVPQVVPSVEGWLRISGEVELGKPRVAVRYEFYVICSGP